MEKLKNVLLDKIPIAVLSAFIYSIFMPLVISEFNLKDLYQGEFLAIAVLTLIMFGPIILIVGVPFAALVEVLIIKFVPNIKTRTKVIIEMFIYPIGSIMISNLWRLIFISGWQWSVLDCIPGAAFLFISMITKLTKYLIVHKREEL